MKRSDAFIQLALGADEAPKTEKRRFDQLAKGAREMQHHMARETVRGAPMTELAELDARAIGEEAQISRSQFAELVGVNLHALANWERHNGDPFGEMISGR